MINSRKIEDLTPEMRILCREFIDRCAKERIDILITSTYRDAESQAALYAQGRTKPGRKVTNAGPGQSFHNYRIAFDFVPIVHGKPQWQNINIFKDCGRIAKQIGLEWAGDWVHFKEFAHCQLPNLTIAELQSKTKHIA